MEATIGGTRIDLGGEKPQTVLLALILAEGRVVTTDRLIDVVWGDNPPAKPNVTLRSYISHLRKLLEPDRRTGVRPQVLVTRTAGYALEIDPNQVDAHRFRMLVSAARECNDRDSNDGNATDRDTLATVKITTQALDLWHSVHLDSGPMAAFIGEADALIDLRSEVSEIRLRALLAADRCQEVIADVRPLIEQDRYRESLREILMIALYKAGRTVESLAEYQLIRTLLAEELGLEPGPTLQHLEHQILSNDQDLLAPTQHHSVRTEISEESSRTQNIKPMGPGPAPVGREHEGQQLLTLLSPTSTTRLAALTGEPGIGKSTLASFVAEEAQRLGHTVAWGRCREGGQSDTHWPWIAVLRDLLQPLDDQTRQRVLGPQATDLAPLLPSSLSATQGYSAVQTQTLTDPMALYDAVCQALIRRSQIEPVLLVFEDLHWADPETVKLISFAAPALIAQRIRMVATWRTTEVMSDDLKGALSTISRLAGSHRLALDGLSSKAIAQLYQQTRGEPSPAGLADEMQDRTDCNPLFVTELLRASSPDAPISQVPTVGEAIDRRLLDLSRGSESLLTIGALCPAGFTESLLTRISGEQPDQVLDRIEDAMAARILEEDPEHPDRFRFTHALIAEQLSNGVSTRRRSILHAKIGHALTGVIDTNSQLAYHFLRGASAGSALEGARHALLAGNDSTALLDHLSAASLFEQGLEALEHVGLAQQGAVATIEIKIDLTVALAQTVKHMEQHQRTHILAREGYELARSILDHERMVVAALVYTGQSRTTDRGFVRQWLGYWTPPEPARAMLEECLEALDDDDPLRLIALLSYTSNSFDLPEDARLRASIDESIAVAFTTGDDTLVVDALLNKIQTLQRCLTIPERQEILDEAIDLSQRAGATGLEVSARSANLVLALDQRSLAEANEEVRKTTRLGVSSGDPMVEMMAEAMDVSVAIFQGRFAESDDRLQTAFAKYARYGKAILDVFGLQMAMLHRERGQLDDLIPMLEWKLAGYPGPAFAAPLAVALMESGRIDEARRVIEEFADNNMLRGGEGVLQFVTPVFYCDMIDHLGDQVAARGLLKALALAEDRLVAMVYGSIMLGSGSLALGRMATLVGQIDEAERFLGQAQDHHDALLARPYQLRTCGALAVLEAAKGSEREAEHHMEDVSYLADELGMQWTVPFIRERISRELEGRQPH